jgi:formylglycine-generating enzyme required for sulfatase activity
MKYLIGIITVTLLLLACSENSPVNTDEKDFRGTISGIVTDVEGNVVSGVDIGTDSSGDEVTGTDGSYQIVDVKAGSYALTFTKTGFVDTVLDTAITLSLAQDIVNINVTLKKAVGGITGVIVSEATNALLSNVVVSTQPGNYSVTTNSEGVFEFTDLPIGTYAISFSDGDYFVKSMSDIEVELYVTNNLGLVSLEPKAGKISVQGALSGNYAKVAKIEVSISGDNISSPLKTILSDNPIIDNSYEVIIDEFPPTGDKFSFEVRLFDKEGRLVGYSKKDVQSFDHEATSIVILTTFSAENALPIITASFTSAMTDTVTINDPISLSVTVIDSFDILGAVAEPNSPVIKSYEWSFDKGTIFIKTETGDTSISAPATAQENYEYIVKVTDSDSNVVFDTLGFEIITDAPTIELTTAADTIVAHSGTVLVGVNVTDLYSRYSIKIDSSNDGTFTTVILDTAGTSSHTFTISTGTASSWDSIKVKVVDEDGLEAEVGVKVDVRPRAINITGHDSTRNSITIDYTKSLESDFVEYQLLRDQMGLSQSSSTKENWGTLTDKNSETFTSSDENYALTKYYYGVVQLDDEGVVSALGAIDSAIIEDTPPTKPIILFPQEGDTFNFLLDTVKLTPSTDANGESVYYSSYTTLLSPENQISYHFEEDSEGTSSYPGINEDLLGGRGEFSEAKIVVYAYNEYGNIASPTVSETISFTLRNTTQGSMKLIPAKNKKFSMGEVGIAEPVHDVSFTYDFWMDSTEVTKDSWDAATYTLNFHPMTNISWYDAIYYCNKKSTNEGKEPVYIYTIESGSVLSNLVLSNVSIDYTQNGYRLPTEAEWEFAYRGGTQSIYFWGDDTELENNEAPPAWYKVTSGGDVKPVAQKPSNYYGLYDMAGNVAEYCNDWFQGDYYEESPLSDPTGPLTGTVKVVRGGDADSMEDRVTAGYRGFEADFTGFRCVRKAE